MLKEEMRGRAWTGFSWLRIEMCRLLIKTGVKSWIPPKCGEFIDYLRNVVCCLFC
jgi:hypothetical protein